MTITAWGTNGLGSIPHRLFDKPRPFALLLLLTIHLCYVSNLHQSCIRKVFNYLRKVQLQPLQPSVSPVESLPGSTKVHRSLLPPAR